METASDPDPDALDLAETFRWELEVAAIENEEEK